MAKSTVDPALLYAALNAARQERGASWRSLAAEVGVSPSLLSRIANGQKPDADGFATIVRWLGIPAEEFFAGDDVPTKQPALMAQLAPLLRARKDLDEADIKHLEHLIAAALERAKAKR